MRFVLVLLITIALFANSLSAQDFENIKQTGRIYDHFGWTRDIQIRDDYAYVAAGCAGLRIIDLSDPTQPELVGYYDDNPYRAASISFTGDLACIADVTGGLVLVDVSIPENPRKVGDYQTCNWYETERWCNSVASSGNYAFTAISLDGFRVFDISSPENPRIIASLRTAGNPLDVFKSGDVVYLSAFNGGLYIIDVSDPSRPRTLNVLMEDEDVMQTIVAGDLAFSNNTDRNGIVIHDVSNIENPDEVGFIHWNGSEIGMCVDDDIFYLAGSNCITSFDISDLQNIRQLCSYHNDDLNIKCMAISDGFICVTGDMGGVRVIDVSDPENLVEIGMYDPPCLSMKIEVENDLLYVIDSEECLRIVDVSNPFEPEEVATLPDEETVSIALSGNIAYVATRDGLVILGIENPSEPREIGLVEDVTITCIAHEGNYVYLGFRGLTILNVQNPAIPEQVGYVEFDGFALKDIIVSGNYVYGYTLFEILCFDVSNPEDPEVICQFEPNDRANAMAISGDYAYIANSYTYDLDIYDISDPTDIQRARQYRTLGLTMNVYASGNHVYLTQSFHGLIVLDISDPLNPVQVGYYDTPGDAIDVAAAGNMAYTAEFSHVGLYNCSQALSVPHSTGIAQPVSLVLNGCYPNPFNSTTTIGYALPFATHISLELYDVFGHRISTIYNGRMEAGFHSSILDAGNLPSGLYFIRLDSGDHAVNEKITLIE